MNPELFSLLGRTFAREEHKGDYAAARALSEANLAAAQQQGNPDFLAEALLDRAIVHCLQEEIEPAFDLFAQCLRLSQNDANRSLRALSYKLVTLYHQYNCMPDGAGGSAIEISVRWNGAADLQPLDQQWQALKQRASDTDAQF